MKKSLLFLLLCTILPLRAQLTKGKILFDTFGILQGQQDLRLPAGFGFGSGIVSRDFNFVLVSRFLQYNLESPVFLYQVHVLVRNEYNYLIPNTAIFWNSGFSLGISEIKLENRGIFNGPIYEIFSGLFYPVNQQTLMYGRLILSQSTYSLSNSEIFRSAGIGIEFGLRFSNSLVKPLDY